MDNIKLVLRNGTLIIGKRKSDLLEDGRMVMFTPHGAILTRLEIEPFKLLESDIFMKPDEQLIREYLKLVSNVIIPKNNILNIEDVGKSK